MADCIFCKIVRGEIPCAKLYEDDQVLSFLDINPVTAGHALVLPKQHFATFFDLPAAELQACMTTAQKVSQAVYRAMGATGLNVLQNNFRSAGQLIDHVHFHLIPRFEGDGFMTSWPAQAYPEGQLEKTLERVRAAL